MAGTMRPERGDDGRGRGMRGSGTEPRKPGRPMGRRARARRRDRALVAAFGAIALVGGGVACLHVSRAQVPAPQVVAADVVTGSPSAAAPAASTPAAAGRPTSAPAARPTRIGFVGDTMLADGAKPFIAAHGMAAMFAQVKGLLDQDYVVANLETPLTTRTHSTIASKFTYATPPQAAAVLRSVGIDAVGLANNHSMDRDGPGLADTTAAVSRAGLAGFGAGANVAEAEKPLILRTRTGTVGIVALSEDYGPARRASADHAGVVPMTPRSIQRGYDLARAAGAQKVVAFVHWGDNYMPIVGEQKKFGAMFARAGYDAVVGTGPHYVQPVEVFEGTPIVWSLGNFVFGSPGRFESMQRPGTGLVADVAFDEGGHGTLRLRCILTDNKVVGYVPRPCPAATATQTYRGLGPAVQSTPAAAVVRF